jgi:hypothetical protein
MMFFASSGSDSVELSDEIWADYNHRLQRRTPYQCFAQKASGSNESESSLTSADLSSFLLEDVWASALATFSTLAATVSFSNYDQRDASHLSADSDRELASESDSNSSEEVEVEPTLPPSGRPHHSSLSPYRADHVLRRGILLLARAACKIAALKQVIYFQYAR